jgi:hypothetical protein
MDDATYEILDSKHSCTFPENPPCSGVSVFMPHS